MDINLPIYASKNEIVAAVNEHDTVIIMAETGSGKSTQARRVACVSLARRVREESGLPDLVVGYQTAFESECSDETGILFCTDGLQLAKGITDTQNILIIDEVHEWNLNIETLVAWTKEYRKKGGKLKIVLMSATMDAEKLLSYYGDDARLVKIDGRTFPVEKHFCESYEYKEKIIKALKEGKNVLAFRSGKKEIQDTMEYVHEILSENSLKACVLPMHGDLSMEEQARVFRSFSVPKLVVSTNIAQTSITIPDINVVIDDGVEKRIETDEGIERLVYRPISKSDIEQRAGRAGRVSAGEYYLCSGRSYENRDKYSRPEIERLLLDKVVLKLHSAGMNARDIEFYHQPPAQALEETENVLKMLNAVDENGVTEFGLRLSEYPISTRSAAMIEKAKEFEIEDLVIKAAALLENQSLINFKKASFSRFTSESRSDLLAEINIFDKLANNKIGEQDQKVINQKVLKRVTEIYEKISGWLNCQPFNRNVDDAVYEQFLKCLLAGHPDHVFAYNYGNWANQLGEYNLNRNTNVYSDILFGIPKIISFKDKWGCERSLPILDKVSAIEKKTVKGLLDESLIEIRDTDMEYYSYADKIVIRKTFFYMGSPLLSEHMQIKRDDASFMPLYRQLLENDSFTPNMVSDGTEQWPAYKNENGAWVVKVTSAQDLPAYDMDDNFGGKVGFLYKGIIFAKRDLLYSHLVRENRDTMIATHNREMKNAHKIKEIKNLDMFETDYKFKMGTFATYNEEGKRETHFYGMRIANDKIMCAIFNNELEYRENSLQALKRLFRNWASEEFPRSSFSFPGRNGKAKTNSSTEECREIFLSYLQETINKLDFSNIRNMREETRNIYQECIGAMEENVWGE